MLKFGEKSIWSIRIEDSRGSSWARDQTHVPWSPTLAGGILYPKSHLGGPYKKARGKKSVSYKTILRTNGMEKFWKKELDFRKSRENNQGSG